MGQDKKIEGARQFRKYTFKYHFGKKYPKGENYSTEEHTGNQYGSAWNPIGCIY